MDPVIDEMEHKRIELTQKAAAVQFQINDLNTRISSKKMQIQNFGNKYNPAFNKVLANSAFQSMKFLQMQCSAKGRLLNSLKNELNNLQKAEVNEVKEEAKVEKKAINSDNKYIAGAQKLHGHMKAIHSFNILFVFLIIGAIYIDMSGFFGNYFGQVNIFDFQIPVILIIEMFFIMWFYADAYNIMDFLILLFFLGIYMLVVSSLIEAPFNLSHVPVMGLLVYLKWKIGTSVSLRSIIVAAIPFIIFFLLIPIITSLPSTLGIDVGSASETVNGTKDSATAVYSSLKSSAIAGISDYWCLIAPLFCENSTIW